MPRETFAELCASVWEKPNDLAIWQAHGYYAHDRLLVQYFMETEGWNSERLLASRLSVEQAESILAAHVRAKRCSP